MRQKILQSIQCIALVLLIAGFTQATYAQTSPYRGLWVGLVALDSVNEVSIPLDENNVAIAPNPEVPTLTYDRADLRILLHVNGAGQVNLLKDVAILNRNADPNIDSLDDVVVRESDMSLVTDPRIYVDFPPQPALRIASSVFDFGDAQATRALDDIVETAAVQARDFTVSTALPLETQAQQLVARTAAEALIVPLVTSIVDAADVKESFADFLDTLDSSTVDAIAADPSGAAATTALTNALDLQAQSFYNDDRAVEMVHAITQAVLVASPGDEAHDAQNAAASFADVDNVYQRFINGNTVGDMIEAASTAAVTLAKSPGATEASIEAGLRIIPESITVLTEAIQVKIQRYDDTRTDLAVNEIYSAMAQAAFANAAIPDDALSHAVKDAADSVLTDMIARYPLPTKTPTEDYNLFVDSSRFTDTPAEVAEAAAQAAIEEQADNLLYTPLSVYGAAKIAAIRALDAAYSEAARANRTELPMTGTFAPGSGDPRMIRDLASPHDLGAAGLEATIYLPAKHPSNPFRHRRHPDHTVGFNIERNIRLDFDGMSSDPLQAAGYGVESLTGTYREEVFGLHKPLGPNPETDPIGLKTEGRFELNRISFIDTLNAR